MLPLSEISWGPTDASEPDDNFLDKFIEPKEIKKLVGPKYWLISGEKGSGKTALCLGITLKHGGGYHCIKKLRFNDIEFCAVIKNLQELSAATDISSLTLISNYWEYVLITEAMKEYIISADFHLSAGGTQIHNYLVKKKIIEGSVLSTMLGLIATCWTFVEKWTKPGEGKPTEILLPSNLESQVVETLSKYPIFDPEFKKMRQIFSKLLRDKNEKVLITLDGFDRLKTSEHCNKESLEIIFEGLIESVYALSISEDFYKNIQIKCFIPYDRYISLDLRDTDKFGSKYRNIRWCYSSLQEFLAKRLSLHTKMSHLKQFYDMWYEVMPEKIENKFYGIDENSYEYVLRHTMYRPRHLQIHLEEIAERYEGMNIDPSMVPKAIRESSKRIANYIIKEYKIDHPLMEPFLRRFKGATNIMPYTDFRYIVEKTLEAFGVTSWTIDKKIDSLYNIGFFGIFKCLSTHHDQIDRLYRYKPPRKISIKPYQCDFYYVKPIEEASSVLDDQSLVTIHPIFFDYCDLIPHPDMIIG